MSDPGSESRKRHFSRKQLWTALAVAAALAAAAAYWHFKGNGGGAANPFSPRGMMGAASVPVRIATAEQGTVDVVFKAIGTVTAYNTVTVRSRVDGELQEILFKDGQKVRQGDVLARIDPRTYQVQLDQALGQQRQNLAQLENARRDLQRYQLLFKQNSIARQQVDAQAALVKQYEGSQKSDQAAVDSARLQLGFTEITAPISGRLGLRKVDQGNLIASSSTDGLVVITQTQPISVVFTLPQAQLPEVLAQLAAGRTLPVDLYDSTDTRKLATGELESVDNQIDVATGTLKLKARFSNEDETLFPNQFVSVRLAVQTGLPAVTIPATAVQQGSKGAFVYAVDEADTVRIQPIVTGTVDGNKVAVASGVQAGQRVVIEGVDRLREGASVEVVTGESAPVRAAPPSSGRQGQGPRARASFR